MRVALSSFTYTWEIGVPGYLPARPFGVFDLLRRTSSLGVNVLQIADNIPLDAMGAGELADFAAEAHERGVDIEVGTRGISEYRLRSYIEIAKVLGSPLLRVVVDSEGDHPTPSDALVRLKAFEGDFRENGVTLAVENHDRYSVAQLANLIHGLGDWAGICLDTVNSFGALEGPAVVLETLAPLAVNLHIKDFVVRRSDHGMGFAIEGRPVGAGQLDIPAVLTLLERYDRVDTGVIELWTPPEALIEDTIVKETRWAAESIEYLRESAGMTN
jgi:sugar phosphate isomerase/epimerase